MTCAKVEFFPLLKIILRSIEDDNSNNLQVRNTYQYKTFHCMRRKTVTTEQLAGWLFCCTHLTSQLINVSLAIINHQLSKECTQIGFASWVFCFCFFAAFIVGTKFGGTLTGLGYGILQCKAISKRLFPSWRQAAISALSVMNMFFLQKKKQQSKEIHQINKEVQQSRQMPLTSVQVL